MQPHPPIHSRRIISIVLSGFFSLALLVGLLLLFQPTVSAQTSGRVVASPLPSAATLVTTNSINLETSAYWTAGDDVDTGAVAWGDMDGDGDLDLAAALVPLGIRIYLNLGDNLQTITDAPLTFSFGMDATDVAWGDVDGDGDLDLAAADKTGSEQLYPNIGGTISTTASWSSSETSGDTYALAWGDVDGDGDLDLAVGNTFAASRLYINVGGQLQTAAAQTFGDSNTQSVAWGDVDNDGDLDLALGNACGVSKVYFNTGGNLTAAAPWSSGTAHCTQSVAWGDMDGDGDLDLALGHRDARNEVYLNVGGTLQTSAAWTASVTETTRSVAWGDVDMDGDLDLAVGNDQTLDSGCNCSVGGEDKVYLNNGGMLQGAAVWQSSYDDKTHSVAWGDIDGDGDLDLAAGNYANSNRVYLNRGNLLQAAADDPWQSGINRKTNSLAWGDADGDGDLDLAMGNEDQPSQVLRNDGLDELGKLKLTPFWTATTSDTTKSVAWGDVDGDGDLDLAVGNYNQQNKVYQNNGLNGLGNLQMSLLWDAAAADYTNGLAWGDVDGDGDLDLAAANGQYVNGVSYTGRPNQIYFNQGGTLEETASWSSAESDSSLSLAWGDVDGDGDLDLAVANYAPESARLYLNQGGTLDTTASWSAGIDEMTYSLAWGDMDGDGDLDLAIANRDAHPGRVYLNQSGTLQQISDFPPTFGNGDSSLGVAWSDVDGDGDLDLVSANELEGSVVFVNEHGSLDDVAEWKSANDDKTTSAAWGDANGDGRPDLAISSYEGPTWVYLNLTTPDLLFDNQPATNLVFDLEQSPANFYATAEIHDGAVPFTYTLYHPAGDSTWSVQGFYSLDGGDNWQPALASSSTQTTNLAISTPITLTTALSFDGSNDYVRVPDDDSLDLTNQMTLEAWVQINAFDRPWQTIIAKGDTAYRLHRFNTTNLISFGTRIGMTTHDLTATTTIADGQWHHVAATFDGTTKRIYIDGVLENSASVSGSVNVTTQPFAIGENLQPPATGRFWHGTIDEVRLWNVSRSQTEIQADRNHTLNGNEAGLVAYWPLDEGAGGTAGDFSSNNNDGSLGNGVAAARPTWVSVETTFAGTHVYNWDVYGSGFLGQSDNVVFRLQASSGSLGTNADVAGSYDYTNTIPGPFLRPYVSSQTFPLRVRGTQIQVLSDTVPVANAVVYLLPAGQSDGAAPLEDLTGTAYETDSQGYLQGRGQLTIGDDGDTADTLYALLPITATDSYTLYYTSASPTEDGLAGQVVTQTGTIKLAVSADHPLLLFNLDISLEWDARNDDLFLQDLEDAIGRTAETLYDVSDGQIALGDVNIYQDGENWLSSDVVLLASNGIRPRASMGGLVDELTDDVVSPTLTISDAYGPGQIRIGPNWDPFGQNQAELTEDWWRAFAHELSHYLLYLPDNYLGLDGDGALVGVDCQGSFMTNTYDGSYSEFLTSSQWSGDCLDTIAANTTGRVDWQTITAFYPWLNAPSTPLTGPSSLPLSLIQVGYVEPAADDTVLSAGNLDLRDDSGDLTSRPSGQGYLIQTQGTTADLTDDAIVALGSTGGGGDRIYARGARPGDRICVFDFSEDPPWLGCADSVSDSTASVTVEEVSGWQPNILVRNTTSTTWAVTVTLATAAPSLNVQIYPSYDSATSTVPASSPWSAMTPLDAGNRVTYTQVITLDYPVYEGWVRVWDPTTTSPVQQALSQVFLSAPWGPLQRGFGGGADSRAWGANDRALGAPVASGDGQVTIFNVEDIYADTGTAALQALQVLPNLPVWLSAVGEGYRFTADAVYSRTIAFDYLQLDVPDGYEHTLHLYYTANEGQSWQRLTTDLDTSDNSASAVMPNNAVQGQGIYALLSTVDMPSFEPGWNQFGYPLPGSRAITTALAAIDGSYSSVYYQDTAADSWRLYDQPATTEQPELAGLVNDLTELEFGRSYWLSATESITLYLGVPGDDELGGHAPEFVPALPPATFFGWITPTVGFNPAAGQTVTAAINGVTCGQTTIQSWQGKLAYRLMVAADNGNGCGAAGQTIIFAVNGQVMAQAQTWDNSQAHYQPLTSLAAAANLAVSQLLMPASPEAGKGIAVLVTVTNNGPLPAAGVLLTTTLPSGAAYLLGAEGVNYCSHSNGTVSCNLGTVAAYASKTAVIGFSVAAAGSYSHTVQVVASPNNDPVMSNNSNTLPFTAGAPTLLSQMGSLLSNSPTAVLFLWPFAFLLLVTGNVLWQRWRRSG